MRWDWRTGLACGVGYLIAEQLFLPDLGQPRGMLLAAVIGLLAGLLVAFIRGLLA